MKIVDFEKKGNLVKFYLGTDEQLKESWGDDWNDFPYDLNAETVYEKYVSGVSYIVFPFEWLVLEPCDGDSDCGVSKEMMKQRNVPCIIAVPEELSEQSWNTSFRYWCGNSQVLKFYFGDEFPESDDILTIDKDYQIKDSINKYIVKEQ